jgi:acyl carrier protein
MFAKPTRPLQSLPRLQEFLADFTSNELEDVKPMSHLEDDLGLTLADDLSRLVSKLNHEFQIKLKLSEVMDELEAAGETVAELAKLIDDECELG